VRHDHHLQEQAPQGDSVYKSVMQTTGEFRTNRGTEGGASLSGHEPNNLFYNLRGRQFEDLSALSGMDHKGDSRGIATWDFDRDGWPDFAAVNTNAPLLQIFRNEIGDSPEAAHHVLAVRLIGGNQQDASSSDWSARDGYGAWIELTLGEERRVREHRAGEGLGSQNSATLLFGIGTAQQVDELRITWPSGRTQTQRDLPADQLVTIYENPALSPGNAAFAISPYKATGQEARRPATRTGQPAPSWLSATKSSALLNLFITMATWCPSCLKELPYLARLRDNFTDGELGIIGVPIDSLDITDKLTGYMHKHKPAYELIRGVSIKERTSIQKWFGEKVGIDALPSTLITDNTGRVIKTQVGLPTLSEVKRLLARLGASRTGQQESQKMGSLIK
jgi:thiol-disulfide isomerase/thioredoxin